MNIGTHEIFENKVILRIHNRLCDTADELLASDVCKEIIRRAVIKLEHKNSMLLRVFGTKKITEADIDLCIQTFHFLTKMSGDLVPNVVKGSEIFLKDRSLFNEFVEYLYNYWRSFDRFILCDSVSGGDLDKRPHRTFNATIEVLTNLVRGVYRDIQENITGKHPQVYRQVRAGAEIATILTGPKYRLNGDSYTKLNDIPVISHVLLYPPLILNPPMNKRSGKFVRIGRNPLDVITFTAHDWICYPAKVGELIIFVYIHKKFYDLGLSLCNLFDLAHDEELQRKPDAVYMYGVPGDALDKLDESPTLFYDDEDTDMLVAAVPGRDEFGYFGYLKKMILTLHNIKIMKAKKLPYHGALVKLILKGDREATMLFIGDTGAGKSETLEALREFGEGMIQDLIIIADDMGSLDIDHQGNIIGYGTEIGAFLRVDDLQPGYAFGQLDRAIIMNPNKVNARITLPVTTYDNVTKGFPIDYVLYANNYENVDDDHPIIEQFTTADDAFKIFKEGTVMSKGTTTTTGIVHSYFANVFGPPQYKELHDDIAKRYFASFFKKKLFVGQIRTRLGLAGFERTGPQEAAKQLLTLITSA